MEINALSIQNVHGITNYNFKPKKLTFITGPSASGKSSLMEAVRYMVSGKTTAGHIRIGASEASVMADVGTIGVLERCVTADGKTKVRLNGKRTTAKSVAEQFSAAFGFSTQSDAGLLMSSEVLEHMLGKDLAEYLLNGGFLRNDMSYERLLTLNPLPPDVADELEHTMFPEGGIPRAMETVTLEAIEAAYQQYRSSRPTLKKLLADERAKSVYTDAIPEYTAERIQEEIIALQAKIAVERKKALDYPKAQRESDSLKARLAKAESDFAAYAHIKPVTSNEMHLANENLEKATKLVSDTNLTIRTSQQNADALQKTLKMLDTSMCPISKQLVCTTDKTLVRSELENALQLALDSIDILKMRLKEYSDDVAKAQATRDELLKRNSEYKIRLNLMQQIEQYKSMSITLPEKPDPVVLDALEENLRKLRALHATALQYEMSKAHAKRADALEVQLMVAEKLVTELAPSGGIRRQVLSHSIGPMEDVCNEMLKIILPKYHLRFDSENNFNIVLEDAAGKRLAYESISNGEQLRVIFSLMMMLNQVNQVRIILLDNLNDLDIKAFEEFIKMLETVDPAYYDHIILSGIDHAGFVDAFEKCSVPHSVVYAPGMSV